MVLIMSCSSIARRAPLRGGAALKESQEQERSELAQLNAEVRADLDKRAREALLRRTNDELLALAVKYGFDEMNSEILWLKKNVDEATPKPQPKPRRSKEGLALLLKTALGNLIKLKEEIEKR
jgi:hypothetical protein